MSAIKLSRKERVIKPARVCLYASMGSLAEDQRMACHLGKNLGAKALCSILSESGTRQSIVEYQAGEIICANGIILRHSGQGVIFSSRDCPVVTVINKKTGEVGSVYAEQQSLIGAGTDCECCSVGILEKLFSHMEVPKGSDMRVYVAGGSPGHQSHGQNDESLLPFIRKFGEGVVLDRYRGILNMFQVIVEICRRYGIDDRNISSDGLCTSVTPLLGSSQAKVAISNWTYVIKT